MQLIGQVLELWHYPVCSLAGHKRESLEVVPGGVPHDRRFVLFDERTGLAAAPEKELRWRPALFLACEPGDHGIPRIGVPGSEALAVNDPALSHALTEYFNFPVAVGACDGVGEMPDLHLPVVSSRYQVSDMHLLTTASLRRLAAVGGLDALDARRFRPTVVLETSQDDDAFVENDWIGFDLQLGPVTARVSEMTKRCGMTLIAQPGLQEQPEILRTILRHNARNLGAYAAVSKGGGMAVGDAVYAEA